MLETSLETSGFSTFSWKLMEPLTKGDEKQSLEKDIKAEPTGFAVNVGLMDTLALKKPT